MNNRGFTLVEMMIVVAIIGIISSATLPVVNDVVDKAKASKAAAEIRTLAVAAMSYKDDNGGWPDASPYGWTAHTGIRHPLNYLMPTGNAKRYLTKYPWPDPWQNSCGYRMHLGNGYGTGSPYGIGYYHSFVLSRGKDRSCNGPANAGGAYHNNDRAYGDDVIFYLD